MAGNQHSMEEVETTEAYEARFMFPCIGHVAGWNDSGEILVDYEGRRNMPVRIVSGVMGSDPAERRTKGQGVLLVFEGGDPDHPIIVGVLEDRLERMASMVVTSDEPEKPKEMVIDGERLIIEGREEIVLRCGSGSMTLRKDGKIVIRGTHILSRSSGPHRIQGGSVSIN
ncbi:hypothetical protein FBQ96_04490 [Nitrospirales bacterium NOB]|nr:hypothetical protein [Nitrospirota bacterium]MDL1888833.1 hypothetical protein [Nitrospirales bacterium NOB]QOJ33777.1 MAG: hypothetical protein HRU82_01915 [Nitrospira sp.]